MSRHNVSLDRAYFEDLYAADADPWRFATSDYEREKYAASVAALPRDAYNYGLEVGCSIGIFTKSLAQRCSRLLALDVADKALAQARQNCPADHVTFENRCVPADWPDGEFDLIVLSEMLYYLDRAALYQTAIRVRGAVLPGGTILLVHYLGETNYPLSGDQAANFFIEAVGFPILTQHRTGSYRIDTLGAPARPCIERFKT
jgi:cyclopropane fatty-acyl-phospholipid synthase-like methyltransferase